MSSRTAGAGSWRFRHPAHRPPALSRPHRSRMTHDLLLGLRRRAAHSHQSVRAAAAADRHRGGVPEQPARTARARGGPHHLVRGPRGLGDRIRPSPERRRRCRQPHRGGDDDAVRRGAARPESPDDARDAGLTAREPREFTDRRSRAGGNCRPVRGGGPARGGVVALRRPDARRRHRPRRERGGPRSGGGHDVRIRGRRVHRAAGACLRFQAGGERPPRDARRMDAMGEAAHGRDLCSWWGSRSCSTSTG